MTAGHWRFVRYWAQSFFILLACIIGWTYIISAIAEAIQKG